MKLVGDDFDALATESDVVAAYRLFLRRHPDANGFAYFKSRIGESLTIEHLATSFLNSEEYKKRFTSCGRETGPIAVDLGGYFVCIDPNEQDFGWVFVKYKDYEPHVRKAIVELLKEGQTFIDIGANVGAISFQAATIVGPRGRVIAFEPNPNNLQRLYAGIMLNKFNHVHVRPFAASDKNAIFSLTGGTSNTFLETPREQELAAIFTQSIILDEELAGLPRIDFVKIDIEGHEPIALRGFEKLFTKHRPILLTEFNPRCLQDVQNIDPVEYLNMLTRFYDQFYVITIFGDDVRFTDTHTLMNYWRQRDEDLTSRNLLTPGMLTFDVVATSTAHVAEV